ncbi:efflux RND transporter periplasmic adaptor subunit [Chromobacterium haemolyticum]|uniref:Efflux RND transporter periplasmic adaptor subunit n=1 Tax=Chromobacterium fluminis TaxID=3044269 RepID=A0ABX0LI31_9NEIS|nr:efflux RND transporter periplasmic adaptor subunit [Chromobacterium haemolyticum]NHR08538.1 efflux RND transporter periplasmic adaptor subunit [Chromobacterium haemolyticum]
MHLQHSLPSISAITLAVAASAFMLSACSQSTPPATAQPKVVKTEIVGTAQAQAASNHFVGTLRARQRSDLSFETAGRIVAIQVEVGDRVRAGQLLARLDEAPARWRLDKAEADRAAAAATLTERSAQLEQQQALARDKIISPTALQSTQAAYQQARSQLDAANAALSTARRDLAHSRITAPFDGEIVARQAQPFTDVAAGQSILQIQSGNQLEVVAMLPESVTPSLTPGSSSARGKSGSETFPLSLERLSARSDNGSLVQAIFRLPKTPTTLRSGGVISVELPNLQATHKISLPASAILPAPQPGQAVVFVLTPSGKLQHRTVHTSTGMQSGGRITITQGLATGERVVVAGAAFLHEGQPAKSYSSETLLPSVQGAER